jgi:hypothetical protein
LLIFNRFSFAFSGMGSIAASRSMLSNSFSASMNSLRKRMANPSLSFLVGASLTLGAPSMAQIVPVYGVSGPSSGHFPNNETSLGFFFTVDQPGYEVNAFGLYKQAAWPSADTYSVTLWSYVNGGSIASDYTPVTTPVNFSSSDVGTYTLVDQWYFQSLPSPISLAVSMPDEGYLLAAVGNFTASGAFYIAEGVLTTQPQISYYRPPAYGDNTLTDFPLPLHTAAPFPSIGYWNANLSLVPGPMPALGAAVGYGMARRLRRRIRGSR